MIFLKRRHSKTSFQAFVRHHMYLSVEVGWRRWSSWLLERRGRPEDKPLPEVDTSRWAVARGPACAERLGKRALGRLVEKWVRWTLGQVEGASWVPVERRAALKDPPGWRRASTGLTWIPQDHREARTEETAEREGNLETEKMSMCKNTLLYILVYIMTLKGWCGYLIDRYPALWQGVVGRLVSGRAVELQQEAEQNQEGSEGWRDGARHEASEEGVWTGTTPAQDTHYNTSTHAMPK